jgi:hypothetical protein
MAHCCARFRPLYRRGHRNALCLPNKSGHCRPQAGIDAKKSPPQTRRVTETGFHHGRGQRFALGAVTRLAQSHIFHERFSTQRSGGAKKFNHGWPPMDTDSIAAIRRKGVGTNFTNSRKAKLKR